MLLTRRRVKNFVALFFLIPLYGFFIAWLCVAVFCNSMMDNGKISKGMSRAEVYSVLGGKPELQSADRIATWKCYDGLIHVYFDENDRVDDCYGVSPKSKNSFAETIKFVIAKIRFW